MIYALIGISASGKSTLARTMVRYMNSVVISRDSLREMLFGYTPETIKAYYDRDDVGAMEKVISEYQDKLIKDTLASGRSVILDNTHLRLKYINQLKEYGVSIKFVLVDTDFETAMERDASRERSVGEDVLRKQFEELEHLKKVFDFKDYEPTPVIPIIQERGRDVWNTFIFDMDGTLALNKSGRSPYDWKRVGEDEVNDPIAKAARALSEYGYKIIICSGRDESCRHETEDWLMKHEIPYRELRMRPKGDMRKDAVVKEEMYRDIIKDYRIIAMFDDRNQVVNHARTLGFTVFQVQDGNF